MPRYRAIACDHCGHLLLRRDAFCDICGHMTRRERMRWLARALRLGVSLGALAFLWFALRSAPGA